MQDPQSNILTALYRQQRDEALRLAGSAQTLTIWEAAAAPVSLGLILVGTLAVLPVILGSTIYVYRVFGGKASDLRYD